MESYQPPPNGYFRPSRPPPPSEQPPSDPQYHQHHYYQQQQHLPPPPPPPTSWNPSQFQYSPSPPPAPPQSNPWGPPPPTQLHPPPPHGYSSHSHQSYPPNQSYLPPPPHSYANQDWGNGNWTHQPDWSAAHSNEEDWAAKAKAWASARSAMENQQPQPHYTSATQQEDPSHYGNLYPPSGESHFQPAQQISVPTSGYSSYQGPVTPLHRPPADHQQGSASVSPYAADPHFSFAANDVVPGGDTSAGFAHHQSQTNALVHQQEVPSSYSSIPGNEDGLRGNQHGNSLPPADGRVMPGTHAQFAYGNPPSDPMDQPLDFASRFSHGNDPKMMSSYPDSSGFVRGPDSLAAVSSFDSWNAPAPPNSSYPSNGPAFPSALQHDHVGVPPLPGQHSPMFGTGPGFQPPFPTDVGLGAGMTLHPSAAFSIDAYGVPLNPERPKKAAVPNWLREEIIKTKATITSSAPEHLKEGSPSIDDDLIDKPIRRVDQADSKSVDSARSNEEDDDEEVEDEQRTAAINLEIKRVLTEVLLKVTDELFDEIAMKVLSEDDHTSYASVAVSDDNIADLPVPKILSPPPPPLSAPKASAKVILPAKVKESDQHASGETSSGSAGNVLGLANYSSDEDDEIQAPGIPKLNTNGDRSHENGHPQINAAEHRKDQVNADTDNSNGRPIGLHAELAVPDSNYRVESNEIPASSRSTVVVDEKGDDVTGDAVKSRDNVPKETGEGPDVPTEKRNLRTLDKDNTQERGVKRHERNDGKKSSSEPNNHSESKRNRGRETEKEEIYGRRDERHMKKDEKEDGKKERERDKKERSPLRGEKGRDSEKEDGKKEREREKKERSPLRGEKGRDSEKEDGKRERERGKKERSPRRGEKGRDSDSRKRSPYRESKESKYEKEREKKRSSKDDVDKKRERAKEEKNDKSRHKSSDVSRHKRRRSSSVDSRSKRTKGSPIHSNGSSDESSGDYRRKGRSKKRNSSPSPVRSRQRDRRTRSRSPVRQHRR